MSFFPSARLAEEFKHRLLKEYDGEYDVLIAFVEIFTARSEELVHQARKAFGLKDAETFTLHVHSLKGSLAQLYLEDMVRATSAIEHKSRAQGLSVDLLEQLSVIEEKLIHLNIWLRENFLGD